MFMACQRIHRLHAPIITRRVPCAARLMTSDQRKARHELLKKIYEPAAKYAKDTPEYNELASSGKVWENYFRPSDDGPYRLVQQKYKALLAEIDDFRSVIRARATDLAKGFVIEYAHQSVAIENNPLKLGDALKIFGILNKRVFESINLTSMSAQDLFKLSLPNLGANPDSSAVNELKNQLVISQWVAENAGTASQEGTPGLREDEVKHLTARSVKDTDAEDVYNMSWGGRVPLGGYRLAPIGVASNPLRIFPYPQEVPACVERFFQWRDSQHKGKEIHPLIHACHLTAYFVHIHPFPDGNGRMSRTLMHDYMVRQGYLPVVFQNLDRRDYIRMIESCHCGHPEEFVLAVLMTQLEQLSTFYMDGS